MAVEARHLSYNRTQVFSNSEMMNAIGSNGNVYSTAIGNGVPPLSGTTTESLLQMYGSNNYNDSPAAKIAIKADSGLTYNLPISRKRPRESINPLVSLPMVPNQNSRSNAGSFTFLGEDISHQIYRQQLEIDRFVAQHTEKVRRDIEERRKQNSRRIVAAVEDGIMSRLRAKEDEIEKIGKLNWALEERVKSLCVENQIWRDLAQTNEATANALRSNLEQVLTHFQEDERQRCAAVDGNALMDDAQSCCGSNYGGGDGLERYTIGGERKTNHHNDEGASTKSNSSRWCRNCGKVESCVLLLPCRHLCLCTVCGSSLHTCPICKSPKEASLHVNLSS